MAGPEGSNGSSGSGDEPQDAAVSHPPSSEQAESDQEPERTPGLGPEHHHRLDAVKEES